MSLSDSCTNTIKRKLESNDVITILIKIEDPVKLENEEVLINNTLAGDYIQYVLPLMVNISNYVIYRCPVMQCHLLIRHPGISCCVSYSSNYLVHTFDPSFLPLKTREKRVSPEEYPMKLKKHLQMA